jgi:hypothetical protein
MDITHKKYQNNIQSSHQEDDFDMVFEQDVYGISEGSGAQQMPETLHGKDSDKSHSAISSRTHVFDEHAHRSRAQENNARMIARRQEMQQLQEGQKASIYAERARLKAELEKKKTLLVKKSVSKTIPITDMVAHSGNEANDSKKQLQQEQEQEQEQRLTEVSGSAENKYAKKTTQANTTAFEVKGTEVEMHNDGVNVKDELGAVGFRSQPVEYNRPRLSESHVWREVAQGNKVEEPSLENWGMPAHPRKILQVSVAKEAATCDESQKNWNQNSASAQVDDLKSERRALFNGDDWDAIDHDVQAKDMGQAQNAQEGRSAFTIDLPVLPVIDDKETAGQASTLGIKDNSDDLWVRSHVANRDDQLGAPFQQAQEKSQIKINEDFSIRSLFKSASRPERGVPWHRASFRFAVVSVCLMCVTSGMVFVGNAFATKDRVMRAAQDAIGAVKEAAQSAQSGDMIGASYSAEQSHDLFREAHDDLSDMNALIVGLSRYVPGASQLASGDALVEASVHLTRALADVTGATRDVQNIYARTDGQGFENFSIGDVLGVLFAHSDDILTSLESANNAIERVAIDDVPQEQRGEFIRLSRLLPPIVSLLQDTVSFEESLKDFFGVKTPRTYLFLFQNNHEMRGSGGFIGSYGFLDISAGRIREFKIDGIYNPDGQLIDKVVPPRPIQKISAAWSLHDSNWWPHFPKSAEKAIDFYGRTGGPSVDGVIAVTPVMVERLLEITGPITLPEYDVTLTSENFITLTQYKVEVDYDKQENRPKKILSDLMPELLSALKKDLNTAKMTAISRVFLDGLRERHIMMYMRDTKIQEIITTQHWGGTLLDAQDDYLSVVHSNINGFKTDGIITENISHSAQIAANGKIVNTVTITREHGGGDTGYEWWDAVNADYMRVYVPEGSRLLSAKGHTREWHEPRLDYEALGFEVDEDVQREEQNAYVHADSGTRVYEDTGKTVFGNWVYVSPGEKVTVEYTYELPWRFVTSKDKLSRFGSHSTLFQKQAGAQNVTLESRIIFGEGLDHVSSVPEKSPKSDKHAENASYRTWDFSGDAYHGVVFRLE